MRASPSGNTQCGMSPPSAANSSSASFVGRIPRIEEFATRGGRPSLIQCRGTHRLRDVLPDGVAVIAVDPSFTLFQVDGVRGKVPVNHRVAIPVKVEALLPDGGSAKHERPEGRIERGTNYVQMLTRLLVRATETVVSVPACKVLTHWERLTSDPGRAALPCRNVQTHGCQPEGLAKGIHESAGTRLSADGIRGSRGRTRRARQRCPPSRA